MKKIKLLKNPVRIFVCDEQGKEMVLSQNEVEIAQSLINSIYYRQDVENVLEEEGYSEEVFQDEALLQEITNSYQKEREISDGSDCDSCKDWRQCLYCILFAFSSELKKYNKEQNNG
ncbi:MAG: hypothetical protein ACI37Z_01110 [Candidatus Gastranaerophilaceae bacterium]